MWEEENSLWRDLELNFEQVRKASYKHRCKSQVNGFASPEFRGRVGARDVLWLCVIYRMILHLKPGVCMKSQGE